LAHACTAVAVDEGGGMAGEKDVVTDSEVMCVAVVNSHPRIHQRMCVCAYTPTYVRMRVRVRVRALVHQALPLCPLIFGMIFYAPFLQFG